MESMTQNQTKQILRFAEDALGKMNLSKPQAQQIIKQGDIFQDNLGKAFKELSVDHADFIADWQDFYKKYFNLKVDLSRALIPEYRADFNRVIVIPKGLTLTQAIVSVEKKINLWTWRSDNLLEDKDVPVNDRDTEKGSYTVSFRDRIEADEELKNKSADDLIKVKITGITLLERLIFELKYFQETGEHLDINTWTLCSGSRYLGGDVPRVGWNSDGGRIMIGWISLGDAGDDLRTRVAVSC